MKLFTYYLNKDNNTMYTILIVEDSPFHIDLLVASLEQEYNLLIAIDAEKSLSILKNEIPDLIILDAILPGMSGFQFLEIIQDSNQLQNIPVIFTTGMDQVEDQLRGFGIGAVDYITKPFHTDLVKRRVALQLELDSHRKHLEALVEARTQEIEHTRDTAVQAVAYLAESRDKTTGVHIFNTQRYTKILASEVAFRYKQLLDKSEVALLAQASALHDIGKFAVSDAILLKEGPLTTEEMNEMKKHTIFGAQAISKTIEMMGSNTFLEKAHEIALSHHEKFDGSGYPHNLKGKAIPISAAIVSIVDIYDALVSLRPYKKAFTHEKAVEIISIGDGRTQPEHFYPELLECFLRVAPQFKEISQTYV